MELLDRIDWAKVGTIAMVTMPIHFGLFLLWWFNVRRAAQARRLRHAAREGAKPVEAAAAPVPAAALPTAPAPIMAAAPAMEPAPVPAPVQPAPAPPPLPTPAKPRLGTRVNRYGNLETYIIKD